MLHAMRKRMGDDKGFTLIELMVVVLIIAILIAIAIPTFLGLRARAQNRQAQSSLRNALTAAKAFYSDSDTFVGFTDAEAQTIEPSLDFVAAAVDSTGPDQVTIEVADASNVVLVAKSRSGTFYVICDKSQSIGYAEGATQAAVDTAAECSGASW